MYGFAILCCPDFRKAMAFAEYITPSRAAATIKFTEEEGFATGIEPDARAAADPQITLHHRDADRIHISLMRDIMGAAFTPDQISLAYRKPETLPGSGPDRMSSKLRKQDQPDHVSVGVAGPSCKSRQQTT